MEKISNIQIWAELWINGSYKRTCEIVITQDQLGFTVNGKKATIKSYDNSCNILKLQRHDSDGEWLINERTSGSDPGEIHKQLLIATTVVQGPQDGPYVSSLFTIT